MKNFLVALGLLMSLGANADVKLSQLPLGSASTTNSLDSFPYVDTTGPTTKRLKLSDLINLPIFGTVGHVTSVGLSDTSTSGYFTITNTPVTLSGTIGIKFSAQGSGAVFAGPTTGSSADPVFRKLVGDDLPNPSSTKKGGVESYVAVTNQWINSISTSGIPASSQPAFSDISGSVSAAQMLALTNTHIYVGNGSSQPADVAMSNDATLANTGALTIASHAISNAKFRQSSGLSLVGNSGTSTADVADITGTADQVCRVAGAGASLGFGSIDLSKSAAVGSSILANTNTTAASTNTASAIVARDGSGNFTAGTITAALTGTASGNTTYTANNHGVVVSGSANTMTVIAPDASATKVLKSGGASADPTWLAYTDANTVSTLVSRDSSGNFSAGTITAALSGNAATATTATTATNATNVATTATSTNASFFPLFVSSSSSGNQGADTDTGFSVNPSTHAVTATTFIGAVTGTASGNTTISGQTNHGVVTSGSASAMTSTGAGTAKQPLVSNGASLDPTFQALDVSSSTAVSGVMAVANGGTGQSSYTNGQLLIGNTSGNTLAKSTLTAGSGITITNGNGTITIASSATGTSSFGINFGGGSSTLASPTVCNSSPCTIVAQQGGSWVSSVTRTSAGIYVLNFSFSAAPICTATAANTNVSVCYCSYNSVSTTQLSLSCGTSSANQDCNVNVTCNGT